VISSLNLSQTARQMALLEGQLFFIGQPRGREVVAMEERGPNAELIGRSFSDRTSEIRVIKVCSLKPATHVIVERAADGKRWSVPAGIVRLSLGKTTVAEPEDEPGLFDIAGDSGNMGDHQT
jgi:hypothetical protein